LRPGRPLLAACLLALVIGGGEVRAQAAVPTAAAAQGAQVPTAELRSQARAAALKRDWTAALAGFDELVARHGDDVDLLIEAARVHGFADRNARAAALYRRALALAPARRADIAPSLAWQSLWGGAPAEARALFAALAAATSGAARVEMLDGLGQAHQAQGEQARALQAFGEAHALAPGQLRLHRRYAMSLLWNGDEGAAIRELRILVARQPSDRDLAWALANALNFDGQHRAALRGFLAQAAPTHPGQRADLARAWRWAGYEERALPLLADPIDADSRWLRDYRVRRELRSYGFVAIERAEDRDKLSVDALVVAAGGHPSAGSTLELQARRLRLDDDFGDPQATQLRALYAWRVGAPDGERGTFWPTLALGASHFPGWNPLTASARLRWVPRDGIRVDGEAARELVEAPRAVAHRVTLDVLSAGVEARTDPRWVVAGSAAVLRFDDGSTRVRAAGRIERRVLARPRVALGVEGMAFERVAGERDVDRGYWNPRRYAEARAYVALTHEIRPFELQARVGVGSARETDDAGQRSHGSPHLWELELGWDVSPTLRLRLAAGGSGQGLGVSAGGSGGAGYWRRYLNLRADVWF
jgi:tetratricopeptide (TPR) repeat protein